MTTLREVVVEVADVAAAAVFYEALGLERHKSGTWEGGEYVELVSGFGLKVMLVEGEGGVRLTFDVDDAEAALAAAVEQGAQVDVTAGPGGGGIWATARDPWGNPLGFWSRG